MAKIRSYTLPADTSPDMDDVLWVDKSGGTTRSITLTTLNKTIHAGFFNVLDYGAVGNGLVDDTAAIQATINAVGANGGTVYLPGGTYSISAPIELEDFVILRGAGYEGSSIRALPTFSGTAMVQNKHADYSQQMAAVESLCIDGRKDVSIVPIGISLRCIGQISYIRDVFMYNVSGIGIVIDGGTTATTAGYLIDNVSVQSSGGDNIVVQGNVTSLTMDHVCSQFMAAGKRGIYLNGSGGGGHSGMWLRGIHLEGDPTTERANTIGIEINNVNAVLIDGVDYQTATHTTGDLIKINGTSYSTTLRGLHAASLLNIINDVVFSHVFTVATYPYVSYYSNGYVFAENIVSLALSKFGSTLIDDSSGIVPSNGTNGFVTAGGSNGDLYLGAKSNSKAIRMNQGDVYVSNEFWHLGANLGFYGHAVTAQQVLATGAAHTVDDVITALQALGLVKQA